MLRTMQQHNWNKSRLSLRDTQPDLLIQLSDPLNACSDSKANVGRCVIVLAKESQELI